MYKEYKPSEVDYSGIVSEMGVAGINAFFVGGYSTDAALLIREARERGYDMQLVSGDALASANFALVAGME